jgi:hypothetical protein
MGMILVSIFRTRASSSVWLHSREALFDFEISILDYGQLFFVLGVLRLHYVAHIGGFLGLSRATRVELREVRS